MTMFEFPKLSPYFPKLDTKVSKTIWLVIWFLYFCLDHSKWLTYTFWRRRGIGGFQKVRSLDIDTLHSLRLSLFRDQKCLQKHGCLNVFFVLSLTSLSTHYRSYHIRKYLLVTEGMVITLYCCLTLISHCTYIDMIYCQVIHTIAANIWTSYVELPFLCGTFDKGFCVNLGLTSFSTHFRSYQDGTCL